MKNFYYVITYNITNLHVKGVLDRTSITNSTDSMVDFKVRSKLFNSFGDASKSAQHDFEKKLKLIYPDDKEHKIRHISMVNPAFAMPSIEAAETIAERFGGRAFSGWTENCCGVIFFADDGDNESENLSPNSWMFKYEIFFSEDSIELSGNGDFMFSPMNVTSGSSTYH